MKNYIDRINLNLQLSTDDAGLEKPHCSAILLKIKILFILWELKATQSRTLKTLAEVFWNQTVVILLNLSFFYYVTTPIIVKLLKDGYNFKSLTIMIQKEVAERMNAEPGNKDYGALSLLVQYYCNTSIVRKVPPSCFIPRPKVDSIVIRLDKLSEPKVKVENEKLFFDIIRSSFNMRRKTLWNGVKSIGPAKEKLEEAFEKAGVNPKRRGETLSIQEFANLANCINEIL